MNAMTEHDVVDEPSTSKQYNFSLENAIKIFDKMVIGEETAAVAVKTVEKTLTEKEGEEKEKKEAIPKEKKVKRSSSYSPYRWKPYSLPRRSFVSLRKPLTDSNIINKLKKIKWKREVDVEELKYTLLEKKDAHSCSVQAARPPSPDIQVDELSEYFTHFVRVDLKMSALAESMYC